MLLGRDAELGRVRRLLDDARGGAGGGLLVLGEPGIGKTALLEAAAGAGSDAGFRVLRATGIEVETELAFSGAFELLRPLADGIAGLPERQAGALRAAFAETADREVDGFAVAAAVLSLLAEASATAPVLCLVDDAQWLDAASVTALSFAVRRIESERIAMIVAARNRPDGERWPRGIPVLVLPGLDDAPARELLVSTAGQDLPEAVASALLPAGRGNPLALRELVGALEPAELGGRASLPDPLPVGGGIAETYRREVGELPARARAAMLVLAVSESGLPEQVVPAVAALTGDPAALDPAERSGLVRATAAGLRFRHPLLRSVIHQDATSAERRGAHRALADTLPAGQAELRAWHRALSVAEPDETVAAPLAMAAATARQRGGRWAECRAYELAARLTPDREVRAERTYRAGAAAFLAGRHELAQSHLDDVLATSADPLLRADAEHERARVALWRGRPDPPERLRAAADRVAAADPERAAKLLAYAVVGLGAECRAAEALPYAREAWDLIGRRAEPLVVGFKVAYTFVMAGETADGARVTAAALTRAEERDDATALAMLGPVLGWLDRSADAYRALRRAIELCRADGDLWMLANALTNAAETARRAGRLDQALVWADEARALSEDIDEPVQVATARAVLARVEADLGRGATISHVAQIRGTTEPRPETELLAGCAAALGTLALASGRHTDAVDELAPVAALLAERGVAEPRTFGVAGDLAEAYIRCGRLDDASRLVADLDAYAGPRDAPSVLATVARCRGLLAPDDEYATWFTESARLFRRVRAPIEESRTLLCFGERLRRQGWRSAAREQLRAALAIFEQRGAMAWADRARGELRATGETRRRADDPRPQLTPQELQIALLVAEGARNQDVATSLFLSPKTVEAHLTRAYRKLGVRSRTQLAARLLRTAVPVQGKA